MPQTVLRCHNCGAAKETKRYRDFIAICFCLPWEGERPFVEISHARELEAPGTKKVQRE